jgi:hypothetical protein
MLKQLDRTGRQGNREFLVEVLMLSLLHQTNLVNLIGYCADGDQRLLVYEFMPLGVTRRSSTWFVFFSILFSTSPYAFFSLFSASPCAFFSHGSIKNDLSSLAYMNCPSG